MNLILPIFLSFFLNSSHNHDTILPNACLNSAEKCGAGKNAHTQSSKPAPHKNVRTFNNMHNSEQVKKKMHIGLSRFANPYPINLVRLWPN